MGRFALLLAALLVAGAPPPSHAETWPDHPVKLILSHPAGSGPDVVARILADRMSRALGQPIVIDNRPGGQNIIGATVAARAPADGYSFYLGTLASLVTNKYLFTTLSYDPEKSFASVGMIGVVPFALVVPPGSPLASIRDFLARGKTQPRLSVANEGPKTFGGMIARLLAARAEMQLNLVAFSSAAAAVNDAAAGQTDAMIGDVPVSAALVDGGKLRALAVTSPQRIASWPEVPAMTEVVPGFEYVGWLAIVAPAGSPAPAVQRFNQAMDEILRDPAVAAQLLKLGPITEGAGTPASLDRFLAAERRRWAKLTQEIGVLPE